MLTEDEVAEIEARANAATASPWFDIPHPDPGPVPAPVEARVVKVHSPTYYEFEWTDENGRTKRRSLIRSQLP